MILPQTEEVSVEEQNPKREEIILPLLAVIEEQTVENLALRQVLDLLWEFFPKGHEGENLGLEPLIDQQRRELAPRVAARFRVFHDRLAVAFGGDHPRLPEGWEQEVRRLIESAGKTDDAE
jgi:hypothetical protein